MHATGPNSPAYCIETCEDARSRIRDAHAPRWAIGEFMIAVEYYVLDREGEFLGPAAAFIGNYAAELTCRFLILVFASFRRGAGVAHSSFAGKTHTRNRRYVKRHSRLVPGPSRLEVLLMT